MFDVGSFHVDRTREGVVRSQSTVLGFGTVFTGGSSDQGLGLIQTSPRLSNSKNEKVVAKTSDVYPKDVEFPSSGVDDMTKLAYLHKPRVLQNLRCRYDMNEIYILLKSCNFGEWGSEASKTKSTKMLMCYLVYMGGRTGTEGRSVEQKVLESNPFLEAFGNAKTVINNNSNHFGKFVELQFDERGRILGAAVRTYLPERSHV
ncbi:hypothetical protein Q3G72_003256 [Acer saccharum]|nr:hypothetical protein Q3G72_003256 [Acer saccharum]